MYKSLRKLTTCNGVLSADIAVKPTISLKYIVTCKKIIDKRHNIIFRLFIYNACSKTMYLLVWQLQCILLYHSLVWHEPHIFCGTTNIKILSFYCSLTGCTRFHSWYNILSIYRAFLPENRMESWAIKTQYFYVCIVAVLPTWFSAHSIFTQTW